MADSNEAAAAQPDGVAATCMGLRVPMSRFLNEARIARINAARYEGQEIAGALYVTEPGDRVLEIGAGIGVVGGMIARHTRAARILSFEANPELIPTIKALYALNGLGDLIEVRNAVLVTDPAAPKTVDFHLRSSFLGSSLLNPADRPAQVVQVPTLPIADVCAELRPTVLIMDIEGGEQDLLRAMDLSGFRAVVLEFHPEVYGVEGMRECKEILREAGFDRVKERSTRTVWTCMRP